MFVPSDSPGVRWEIETLRAKMLMGKVLFLMSPGAPDYDLEKQWIGARRLLLGQAIEARAARSRFSRQLRAKDLSCWAELPPRVVETARTFGAGDQRAKGTATSAFGHEPKRRPASVSSA